MTLAAVLTAVATSPFSSVVMMVIMFFLCFALVRRGKETTDKEFAGFRNEPGEITLEVSQQAYVKGIFLAIFIVWTALTAMIVYIISEGYTDSQSISALVACLVGYVLMLVSYVNITHTRLEVTTKRIRGSRGFKGRFDMPISSVNTISMSAFSGITIGTASGPFVFNMLKNQYELYSTINDLIMGYYDEDEEEDEEEIPTPHYSNADELKKYKELLDMGAITEEEYNAKKKQLLGL